MNKILVALALLIAAAPAYAAKETKQQRTVREARERGMATISRNAAEAHIGFMASDELKGREAGSDEGRIASRYIESYFRQLGLEPWTARTISSLLQPTARSARRKHAIRCTPIQ